MNKILLSFILGLCILSTISFGQTISWPINYSVTQRNTTSTGGSATVVFAGQVYNNSSVQYKIESLDEYGSYVSDWKAYQSLPGGSLTTLGTSSSSYFYFSLSVPTGWYRFTIKEGGSSTESVKFGVGEVFVIAGQSNAQGFGSVYYIPSLSNYDCVVSSKNSTFAPTGMTDLESPVFGVLNSSDPFIGPVGDRPWYYQDLGNKIAKRESGVVIPVCFFNTALAGTSIDNWYDSMQKTRSMFSSNYANTLNLGSDEQHHHPWGNVFDKRYPYFIFKNTIAFYGNMFGVRAVLWHQGEAETKTLLTQYSADFGPDATPPSGYNISNYSSKLNSLISDSRTILPNLPWAISKVSLISNNYNPTSTFIENITNSSGNLNIPGIATVGTTTSVIQQQVTVQGGTNVSWASQLSDTFNSPTYRSDGTHFSDFGLREMSKDIYDNSISGIFGKSPVLSSQPVKLTMTRNSGTGLYTASTTSGYSNYNWVTSMVVPYSVYFYNQSSLSMGNSFSAGGYGTDPGRVTGFVKNSTGRITMVSPFVRVRWVIGARPSSPGIGISNLAFPNPLEGSRELNVSFELEEELPVTLSLYTQSGEIIEHLEKGILKPGKHEHTFSLENLKLNGDTGLLYYKLVTPKKTDIQRIIYGIK